VSGDAQRTTSRVERAAKEKETGGGCEKRDGVKSNEGRAVRERCVDEQLELGRMRAAGRDNARSTLNQQRNNTLCAKQHALCSQTIGQQRGGSWDGVRAGAAGSRTRE
jgi:hypothetical protein